MINMMSLGKISWYFVEHFMHFKMQYEVIILFKKSTSLLGYI
jgi:hypothetical protein